MQSNLRTAHGQSSEDLISTRFANILVNIDVNLVSAVGALASQGPLGLHCKAMHAQPPQGCGGVHCLRRGGLTPPPASNATPQLAERVTSKSQCLWALLDSTQSGWEQELTHCFAMQSPILGCTVRIQELVKQQISYRKEF